MRARGDVSGYFSYPEDTRESKKVVKDKLTKENKNLKKANKKLKEENKRLKNQNKKLRLEKEEPTKLMQDIFPIRMVSWEESN